MNIAFVNPPFLDKYSRGSRSPAVTKSGTVYYPIWLAMAAGYAEKMGHNIALIDAPPKHLSKEETIEEIKNFVPKIIVIETSTGSISNDAKFTESLKKTIPSSFIVLVGNHVTAVHEESLRDYKCVDAIARREYEETIVHLAKVLNDGDNLEEVDSLTWRDKKGNINVNKLRKETENLDDFPFTSKIFKRFCNPRQYFFAAGRYPQIMVYTGRGCPYRCTYCVYPQNFYGHRYRHRSAKNIAEEFKYIEKSFPEVVEVTIEDDTFTLHKERVIELCKLLKEQNNRLTWTCNARADLDYDTMRWMKKAGCRLVTVGFESGSNEILKLMKKGIRVDQYKIVENARKTGILIHGCFMFGNRGETLATMRETLDLALKLNPDTAQFYPLMVYPGTEAYNWAKEEGLLKAESWDEWLTKDGMHNTVIRTHDLTSQEIVEFCDYARRKYYWRTKYFWIKIRSLLFHPGEWRRTIKAFGSFYKHLFDKESKRRFKKYEYA